MFFVMFWKYNYNNVDIIQLHVLYILNTRKASASFSLNLLFFLMWTPANSENHNRLPTLDLWVFGLEESQNCTFKLLRCLHITAQYLI